MTILDEIAQKTRERIAAQKRRYPLENIRRDAEEAPRLASPSGRMPFELALSGEGMSFICEVKKASPSKGIIAEEFLIWKCPGV